MDRETLKALLEQIGAGELSLDDALDRLSGFPVSDADVARLDTHRRLRTGVPEVVYCEHKSTDQVLAIIERMIATEGRALATRVREETGVALTDRFTNGHHDPVSGTFTVPALESPGDAGGGDGRRSRAARYCAIVAAGTSDLPVAEEAAVTLAFLDRPVERIYDVGVAGLHRLIGESDRIRDAAAVITVAGMEGALTSVVGGLVAAPVIGVPTSVGYGASFGGVAALLSMLNSCAPGVSVVNIDNGFGAAVCAHAILAGASEDAR